MVRLAIRPVVLGKRIELIRTDDPYLKQGASIRQAVLIDKTVLKILYYVRAETAQKLRIGETAKMRVTIPPNN